MECKVKHSTAFLCLRLSPTASMLLRGPGLLAQIPALGCFAMASYYLKYLYQRFCGSIIFMLWFFPFHKQQGFRHPNRLNLRNSATPPPLRSRPLHFLKKRFSWECGTELEGFLLHAKVPGTHWPKQSTPFPEEVRQKAAALPISLGIIGTFLVHADSFYKRPSSGAEGLEGEFEGQRASWPFHAKLVLWCTN